MSEMVREWALLDRLALVGGERTRGERAPGGGGERARSLYTWLVGYRYKGLRRFTLLEGDLDRARNPC